MKKIIVLLLFLGSFLNSQSQTKKEQRVKEEVLKEMKKFYNQMRAVDLKWMDYLSEDATAVHNGQFHEHNEFVRLEKQFFNSLKKLEITVLTKPVVYVLGPNSASVTQEHSVNTWYKNGQNFRIAYENNRIILKLELS